MLYSRGVLLTSYWSSCVDCRVRRNSKLLSLVESTRASTRPLWSVYNYTCNARACATRWSAMNVDSKPSALFIIGPQRPPHCQWPVIRWNRCRPYVFVSWLRECTELSRGRLQAAERFISMQFSARRSLSHMCDWYNRHEMKNQCTNNYTAWALFRVDRQRSRHV